MRWVVVLPAPLGPSSPTISPAATSRSMPRTASIGPVRDLNVRASPRAEIMRAIVRCTYVLDLIYAPEVAEARVAGKPIVALESTLIAHGLPWPESFEVARELEASVR